MSVRVLPSGERAILVELDDAVTARALAERLRERPDTEDVVPGARTVLVVAADPAALPGLRELVETAAATDPVPLPTEEVVVEVDYDGEDLAEVADLTGLSPEEIVRRHSAARYRVEFVGFAPGFAYLTGLDPVLHLPRLSTPRPSVPAGSVAIAGAYAAVYPRSSPGGWRLLGRTSATLFDVAADPPTRLAAGTEVRFVPR